MLYRAYLEYRCMTGALILTTGLYASSAFAQPTELPPPETYAPVQRAPIEPVQPPPPAPMPPPEHKTISGHYMEFTMGFIAGGRRYTDATFESQNGVAPALTEPFGRAPFDGINAFGLRYDLRATVSYVRMTIGLDVPFPSFRTQDTQANYILDGMMHSVSVQSLRAYELRFGIGGEYPIWVFAPFVDLIGAVSWANASLAVDDVQAEYRAQGFGFSIRGGCRLHLRPWFFAQLSAEGGVYGPIVWNTELSLGFALGDKRSRD